MKKLYLLLTALVMTFSANAADWFISGGFQGWAHANANYQFKPVEGKEGLLF